MPEINKLDIFILYYSNEGRCVDFVDIVQTKDMMDLKDYELNSFLDVGGGFKLVLDGYKTIFHSIDFHYLLEVIKFLTSSLYWINRKDHAMNDFDIADPDAIEVKMTNRDTFQLRKDTTDNLLIS